jgi:uncharacterized protein
MAHASSASCRSDREQEATLGWIPTNVAVFLENFGGLAREADRIAEIETTILYDAGAVINALPFEAGAYRERTGLMGELRREGFDL